MGWIAEEHEIPRDIAKGIRLRYRRRLTGRKQALPFLAKPGIPQAGVDILEAHQYKSLIAASPARFASRNATGFPEPLVIGIDVARLGIARGREHWRCLA